MGQISRHEVAAVLSTFKNHVTDMAPPAMSKDNAHLQGVQLVEHEFNSTTGAPSVLLRNYARVMKHYNELPKDAGNVPLANQALWSVSKGIDPTRAIKRARTDIENRKKQELADRKAFIKNGGIKGKAAALATTQFSSVPVE